MSAGNGVVINLPNFFDEVRKTEEKGLVGCMDRLVVSSQAHLGKSHDSESHDHVCVVSSLGEVGSVFLASVHSAAGLALI